MQYFLNYVLGYSTGVPSQFKADQGTIVHKVLEILANLKHAKQRGENGFEDDCIGWCEFKDWMDIYHLTNDEVDKINKTRSAESIYKWDCYVEYGHTRKGKELVEDLIQRVYDYYTSCWTHHNWTPAIFRHISNWVWIALDYSPGNDKQNPFDPRQREIHAAEPHFDIEIKKPWAEYEYELDGKKLTGNLSIKGTIDLITRVDDDTLEIIDWKGLPVETPIFTNEGWSTMGELNVGDIVFDKDGFETKILAKSKASIKPCYRITFDDGCQVECDNEHLWTKDDNSVVCITELSTWDKICESKPVRTAKEKVGGFGETGSPPRTIVDIQLIDSKLTQCIMVDSPTNTYLCTENFIPTHNTGQRVDWAGKDTPKKDFKKLQTDTQLMLYYYAAKHLYPDIKDIMVSIFFIRDGGPFSICFDEETLAEVEKRLMKTMRSVQQTEVPSMISPNHNDFRCKHLCHFYKTNWPGTEIPVCDYVHNRIKSKGVEYVQDRMRALGNTYDPSHYRSPGSVD